MIGLDDVTIRAGGFALESINLHVPAGACGVLMGRTGSGKSTILEAICGLRRVERGQIHLRKRDVTHAPPAARQVGYVPQDLALFPTHNVRQHLEFALRLRGWSHARRDQRVQELAALLGIEHLLGRGVQHLSGGEAQRVALGRALSFQPSVLLLDEPFSALDEPSRDGLCRLLRRVLHATGLTCLHVTHSRHEARDVGDLLYRIEDGRIRAMGPPRSTAAEQREPLH